MLCQSINLYSKPKMKLKEITSEMVTRDEATGKWEVEGLSSEPVYKKLLADLNSQTPFSLSRYGDGEWNAIFEKAGHNCDKHEYFPEMGAALKQAVLSEPEYVVGIQPLTMSHYREQVVELAGELDIDWVNSDVLHDANITEHLKRFLDALKDQPVILIAPERLEKVPFKYTHHIQIPLDNCWNAHGDIEDALYDILDDNSYHILLFCASMATNVMIHNLYQDFGKTATMIDAGSIFDVHCGFNTRSYHHKMQL